MLSEKDKKIEWFKNAKLGLFIHWGLYAATEGYWNGKETPGIGEWIAAKEEIPNDEYEKLATLMTCEKFNADEWAELAKKAGMRYCVFTAKHHEGFAMYDTEYDDYSIVKRSPYKKDIAMEISQAMRKQNIVPCFYYSHAIDFHESEAMGNTWYYDTPEDKRDFLKYINGKCKAQLKELLTNYGDLGLIWMDVPKGITEDIAKDLKAYVKEYQPDCLVSGRIGGTLDMGDFGCLGDNQIPTGKLEGCWETASTMNDTWGYKRDDHNFKPVKEIIELLCAIVSKGTNLLLNIGPTCKGEIPKESIHILNELGKWMSVNSEAIYETEASPFKSDFTFGQCCQKDNNLYFFVTEEFDELIIKGIKNNVTAVSVLGYGAQEYKKTDILKIKLNAHSEYVTVVKVTLDGAPQIEEGIFMQEGESVFLPAYLAKIEKNTNKYSSDKSNGDVAQDAEQFNLKTEEQICISPSGVVENWVSTKDYISWDFYSDANIECEVLVYTMSKKYVPWTGGQTVYFECDDISDSVELKEDVKGVGANKKYFDETGTIIGKTKIKRGKNSFSLFASSIDEPLSVSKIILKTTK